MIQIRGSVLGQQDPFRLYLFDVVSPTGDRFQINSRQLRQSGYSLSETADCSVRLTFADLSFYAVCAGAAQRAAERLVSERSGAPSSEPARAYVRVIENSAPR